MRTITIFMVFMVLSQSPAFADEVHYNAPMGGNGESGICLQQLVYTQKDLDKQKFERDIAVREMNYMKENEGHSTGTTILWTVIGIAAGAGAGYAAFKK